MVITFDIHICPIYSLRCGINFRFTAAMLDFRLNGLSDNVGVGIIEKFDPEKTRVAAGISFLCSRTGDTPGGDSTNPMENQSKYFMVDIN